MADGELNVDSLITRLLEGESGPGGPRGGDALLYPSWSLGRWSPGETAPLAARFPAFPAPRRPPRMGAKKLVGRGSGLRERGRARGAVPAGGQCPADLRGPARRRAAGARVDPSQEEGAGMRAPMHCMPAECVFLLCSLCALPLAASGFLFWE